MDEGTAIQTVDPLQGYIVKQKYDVTFKYVKEPTTSVCSVTHIYINMCATESINILTIAEE